MYFGTRVCTEEKQSSFFHEGDFLPRKTREPRGGKKRSRKAEKPREAKFERVMVRGYDQSITSSATRAPHTAPILPGPLPFARYTFAGAEGWGGQASRMMHAYKFALWLQRSLCSPCKLPAICLWTIRKVALNNRGTCASTWNYHSQEHQFLNHERWISSF